MKLVSCVVVEDLDDLRFELIFYSDEMMAELEPVMKKLEPKIVSTRDNLYDYFILRARANLHIALCFSPVCTAFCISILNLSEF